MMALFEFLDPGTNGENINYWLSGKKTVKSNSNNEKLGKQGRTRFLQPLDEFFLTICITSSQLISNSSVDCQSNFYYMDQLHVLKTWPAKYLAIQKTC